MSENEVIHTPEDKKAESTVDTAALTKLKSQLRAKAEREVLQNHQDEYHQVASRLFAEHGLEFSYRLSPEARARKQIEELAKKAGIIVQISEKSEAEPDAPAVLEDRSNLPF